MLDRLFSKALDIRKNMFGELVNYFIVASEIKISDSHQDFECEQLKLNAIMAPESDALLNKLKTLIYNYVIDSPEARTIEFGGQTVIMRLFKAIRSNPTALLDLHNRDKYQQAKNEQETVRVICDYIASMSDEYAYRMHERLFGFNTRTVFERL